MKYFKNNVTLYKYLPLVFVLLLVLSTASGQSAEFIIFHTADIHGAIAAQPESGSGDTERRMLGGFSTLKSLINKVEASDQAQNARIMYLDSGDFFQGTPIVDRTQGAVMIDMFNHLGLTATTIGNHEFDYSYPTLQQQLETKEFSVIIANLFEKETGKIPDFAEPYKIYTHNGIKLGVLGITTVETPSMSFERNVKDVIFADPVPIAQEIVTKMRNAGVDFIIVLSHIGYNSDMLFASQVPGIDLILGGHSHTTMNEITWTLPYNTALIHSGSSNQRASVINLKISRQRPHVISFKNQPLYVDEIGADEKVLEREEYYMADLRQEMERVIGTSDVVFSRGVSGGDSSGGSIISESMLAYSDADVAFINFGGVRQALSTGNITIEDAFMVQPFDNYIEVLSMNGKDLLTLVEKSLANDFTEIEPGDTEYIQGNLAATGLRRVVGPPYGYLLPANLIIHFDPLLPAMSRITKITEDDGTPIDPNRIYRVALNDFVVAGGDGYSYLSKFTDREKSEILVRDALIKYIESRNHIAEPPIRRIYNQRLQEPQFN